MLTPAFDWLPDLFSESLHSSRFTLTQLSAVTVAYDAPFERSPESLFPVDDDPLTLHSMTGRCSRSIRT